MEALNKPVPSNSHGPIKEEQKKTTVTKPYVPKSTGIKPTTTKFNTARKPLDNQKSIQDSIDRMVKGRLVMFRLRDRRKRGKPL